jgi:hypothetical protein
MCCNGLYIYVCFKYFIWFRRILQVFHLDVAKLDRDVAYICKCFRCFYTYVATILSWCLHMFAMATHVFSSFFLFCKYFRRMLQVFHLFRMYVASVSSECYKSRSGVTHVAIHVRRGERSLCAVWWCGPYVAARNASSRRGVLAQARETKCRTFRG